jgi:hypothetical protein
MPATSLQAVDRFARADTSVATLLRNVLARVEDGEDLAAAFADEFTAEHSWLRAASAFTIALPVVTPTLLEEMPRSVVVEALKAAITAAETVRPRNFTIAGMR